MDYYRLARLLKNVIYNFMRMFKYMSYCSIAVCFIAVCLLLMSSKSECSTFEETTADIPQSVLDRFEVEQQSYPLNEYDYFIYKVKNNR